MSVVVLPDVAVQDEQREVAGVRPILLGLGRAQPEMCLGQMDIADRMADIWKLSASERRRFDRLVAHCGVETRCGVAVPEEIIGQSTQQRMELYERCAPELAERAARAAMGNCGIAPRQITDVFVVSCTGFSAPGVDIELVQRLGLRPSVHRSVIGFMGCFGAMIGLRNAMNAVAAQRNSMALVVCVELCSLHWRNDRGIENQIVSTLFADGAAAAVVASDGSVDAGVRAVAVGQLLAGHTTLVSTPRELMSWRIRDDGFAMTLDAEVPGALGRAVQEHLRGGRDCDGLPDAPTMALHPGGPSIVDAVDEALRLDGRHGIEAARAVLRRCGNMSSATVLFVLAEALRCGHAPPITLLAFGPGLTLESIGVV